MPKLKSEKTITVIYGYDIRLDASSSFDESYLREKKTNVNDSLLNFSWECPVTFKDLCKINLSSNPENKILNIKYLNYKSVISPQLRWIHTK